MSILPNPFPGMINNNNLHDFTKTVNKMAKPSKKFKAKKAGTNGSHVFLILDESGSMSALAKDTIGGVNTLIEKQREDDDGTKLTIVKFEGGNITLPVNGVDVDSMGTFKDYRPGGGTNLLDAVGFTMNKINDMLSSMKKKDRPSIFVQIVTDGEENISRDYIKEEIQGMVGQATNADWIITYVGANVDAFNEASNLGIHASATSNYSTSKTGDTYAAVASSLTRMKSMRSSGFSVEQMYSSNSVYTDEEKKMMEDE